MLFHIIFASLILLCIGTDFALSTIMSYSLATSILHICSEISDKSVGSMKRWYDIILKLIKQIQIMTMPQV